MVTRLVDELTLPLAGDVPLGDQVNDGLILFEVTPTCAVSNDPPEKVMLQFNRTGLPITAFDPFDVQIALESENDDRFLLGLISLLIRGDLAQIRKIHRRV